MEREEVIWHLLVPLSFLLSAGIKRVVVNLMQPEEDAKMLA